MTAQMHDQVDYHDTHYALIGVKGEGLLTPKDFNIEAVMWHTGCYRGYIATYSCIQRDLYLTELHIGHLAEGSQWKTIQGIEPETVYLDEDIEWGKTYRGLRVPTGFSGGLLIANGFIQDLYVHMGFGKPYQFEQVHELLFHEGTLIQAIDHSEKAAAWRDSIRRQTEEDQRKINELKAQGLSNQEISDILFEIPSEEEMREGIEWRFSLDYDQWL